MTPEEISRLKSLADRIKDRDVGRFAREREQSRMIAAERARIYAEIDQTTLSGEDVANATMHAICDQWRIWAEGRLRTLDRRALEQLEIEKSARNVAAQSAGRREALEVIGSQIRTEATLKRNRRAERDESGARLRPKGFRSS